MASRHHHEAEITPDLLLRAYACGIFPMAESADDPHLHWIEPKWRGIIPLDGLHVSRSLAKVVRSERFEVVADRDFARVLDGCAAPADGREKTWINARIRGLYTALFAAGHCHSVEVYRAGHLVGGLYGVSQGAAFFGESMFHTERDASKVALVHLVARLRLGGYRLLDTQFVTPHLLSLGAVEVSRNEYLARLRKALEQEGRFDRVPAGTRLSGQEALDALVAPRR
jgi:leucyl/phenylalanyl-tRNA--protein transferase